VTTKSRKKQPFTLFCDYDKKNLLHPNLQKRRVRKKFPSDSCDFNFFFGEMGREAKRRYCYGKGDWTREVKIVRIRCQARKLSAVAWDIGVLNFLDGLNTPKN
jgi:hypothetical protein